MTNDAPPPSSTGDDARRRGLARFHRLQALGEAGLPPSVTTREGDTFTLRETIKHDFFAATGIYDGLVDGEAVVAVLKHGRTQRYLGLPMRWLARYLTRHEVAAYQRFADCDQVPAYLGVLPDECGFLHVYAPGRPLQKTDRPSAEFFDGLRSMIERVHAEQMAYVDLNKRQNILLGDDGRAHLIDFQISFGPVVWRKLWWPARWLSWPLGRLILRVLQRGDRYHIAKHKHRLRPDLCSEQETALATRGTLGTRIHRVITWPLQKVRRGYLNRVRKDAGVEKGPG